MLTICDASLGYHLAPLLGRMGAKDDEEACKTTQGMRKLLSGVVALYAFLDCLAYFRESIVFLVAVAFVIVLDMGAQFVLINKLRKKPSN